MKTAMQELIEYIEKRYAGQVSEGIILKGNELLEKEKQQIIESYGDGRVQGESGIYYDSIDYYKETFKND